MQSSHVVHVNEADFQTQVLEHSAQQPVVVDFWAEWCIPCRTLDPILERLTEDAGGAFRLAKLDVDTNPRLAMEFGVKGIPAVKAFRNGLVVAEFNGLQPEAKIRNFLNALGSETYELAIGRAEHLLAERGAAEAEAAFREVLEQNPDHASALLGLAKCLLLQGLATEALPILRNFPVSKQYSLAEQLTPLAQAMAELFSDEPGEDDLSALYANSLRLAGRGELPPALDGLLELLREDKTYRRGEARKAALGMLILLGEGDPQTRQYRQELASLLF